MKKNINLGSKDKFVGWKTNGVTNCLDLCKTILKKYKLTEFGSSSNVFKLMYEQNGLTQIKTIGNAVSFPSNKFILATKIDIFLHCMIYVLCIVGIQGFEPWTSCSQSRHTNLTVLHPEI